MPDDRFPICTPVPPPMVGRNQLMAGLVRELTKETPSHRSIVGARYAGKSVVLAELARRMAAKNAPYRTVIEWDLGHNTPRTDEAFLQALSRQIGQGLTAAGEADYGDHLRGVDADFYAEIAGVLDMLAAEDKCILMLWDGFDKPLTAGTLTRNLWDNLRELCLKSSLRLVTATRRNLSDLIRDEKSVTSDFWNIFGNVVRVGPFSEADIDAVIATLPVHTFAAGARTELLNWSGGNPPLLLSLLDALIHEHASGQLRNDHVNQAANKLSDQVAQIVAATWSDCPTSAQDLRERMTGAEVELAETASADRDALVEKGFALVAGQRLLPTCRLLDRHLQGAGPDSGSLSRLFGTWDDYHANIPDVLKRRLSHISRHDQRLYRYVETAVGLLYQDPEVALNNLTSIEERALDVVWTRECDSGKKIPVQTVGYWTEPARNGHRLVSDMMRVGDFEIPSDRWKQLGVLQLLTGSYSGFDSRARCTTKDTYVLLNAIHSLRNRSQHADGQEIHVGVAAAALMLCVELLACLSREGQGQ
jgi:hypothetical protein